MPRPRHSASRPGARSGRSPARQEITQEAARIMAEEGLQDFHAAKLKAAQRLNLPPRDLPTNLEIDTAFGDYLRLFHPERESIQARLIAVAIKAMQLLEQFHPRLVGPILTGNVTRFSDVCLHVVASAPEEIAFFLQDNNIPHEQGEKRLRFSGERFASFPTYRFSTDGTEIEIVAFSPETVREAPLSAVDGKPTKRATAKDTEALINS